MSSFLAGFLCGMPAGIVLFVIGYAIVVVLIPWLNPGLFGPDPIVTYREDD